MAGGKIVEILRDTGCNGYVVRKEFVDEEDLTGNMGFVTVIDGSIKEATIAEMKVNTTCYSSNSSYMLAGFCV